MLYKSVVSIGGDASVAEKVPSPISTLRARVMIDSKSIPQSAHHERRNSAEAPPV